jgi:hypothetical protein
MDTFFPIFIFLPIIIALGLSHLTSYVTAEIFVDKSQKRNRFVRLYAVIFVPVTYFVFYWIFLKI